MVTVRAATHRLIFAAIDFGRRADVTSRRALEARARDLYAAVAASPADVSRGATSDPPHGRRDLAITVEGWAALGFCPHNVPLRDGCAACAARGH